MSEYQEPDLGKLSDREILIVLVTQGKSIHGRLDDHGKRIRVLEGAAKAATGALAVMGIIAGWFKVTAKIQ